MFNRLICDRQCIKITLLTLFIINHLIIANKAKAQTLTPQPIKIFPYNYTNVPELWNQLYKPEANSGEHNMIKPTTANEPNNSPNLKKKELQLFILNALSNSASKYPWIIDPRYNLTSPSAPFNPFQDSNYIDFTIKYSPEDPIIERFNLAQFPQKDQFYWVLPKNRIVIETQGWQNGILYQGESLDYEYSENVRASQRLRVSFLPQSFQELAEETDFNQFSIPSITTELFNPETIPVSPAPIWVDFDQRETLIGTTDKIRTQNWQRFYFSRPHNRTLLQYDSFANKATYTNIYSNPGVSLSFSFDQIDVDLIQTANTSLGMLIGGIFELINPPKLEQSFQEAQERFSRQENFASLNSKSTPEQRRKINQILNRTLFLGDRTSSLEQISGKLTFPSTITPNSSSILQIRTGNHRRAVQFIDEQFTWSEGEIYISNHSFGSLTAINLPISSEQISNLLANFQGNFTSFNRQENEQEFNSSNMEFGNLELSQNYQITANFQTFSGYLYLPAVEALWAGVSGNWSYSINSGIWFNLNADQAFNITNNFGASEPTIGVYANGSLNYINSHIQLNNKGQIQAITSHVPSLRLHWNSAANYQNPAYINLSYSFLRQDKNRNSSSLTAGIILLNEDGYLTPSGIFEGALELNTGLEFKTTVEINNGFFYTLEGVKQVNSNWYFGGYLQNFRNISRGISNRANDFSYGLLIKRDIPVDGMFWESRLGMSGSLFEARFEGGFRF